MKKTLRVCPSGRGRIAPESVESISNTIKKETEVSLGLTIAFCSLIGAKALRP
jgi:hypothetical protein